MTFKIHIIVDHYLEYFHLAGKTLHHTNGEFVESTHFSVKNEDKVNGFKVKRVLGTPVHVDKSFYSMVWHNSKRVGLTSLLNI